jgi:ribosomal subunit interface protein
MQPATAPDGRHLHGLPSESAPMRYQLTVTLAGQRGSHQASPDLGGSTYKSQEDRELENMQKLSEDEMDAPVEIVVTSRNVDVSEHFRLHIMQRLVRLERYDSSMIRYDVELDHENNPRQSKASQRVAILGHGKGGTVHAEARGPDFRAALTPQSPSWRRGCDETTTAAGNTTTDASRRPLRRRRHEARLRVRVHGPWRCCSARSHRAGRQRRHRCHQHRPRPAPRAHASQPAEQGVRHRPTLHLVPDCPP